MWWLPSLSSALLCLFLSACYHWRPLSLAAVTVYPVWLWLLPGLALCGLGWRKPRPALGVSALWFLFLLLFAEEPWSLLHSLMPEYGSVPSEKRLRIVSLNCAGGLLDAGREVARCQPDIVLLQESPAEQQVRQLAKELFGQKAGLAYGPDASIIAKGKVEAHSLSREENAFFTHATVTRPDGRKYEVFSLRLTPPSVCTALWSAECWREHTRVRYAQMEQLAMIARRVEALPSDARIVVGGDFNMPQGDAPFRLLRRRLRDSFRKAGAGWGNTITNDYPFLRIDQIWLSPNLRPIRVRAYRTIHSDHRIVVCEVAVDERD